MATRLAQRLLTGLFTLLVLAGCTAEESPISAQKSAALTPAEIRTIKFELLSDWHRFSGVGTLASSTNHSEGQKSLALSGMGYIAARNLTPLTKDDQQTPQVVGYDIWVPTQQPNPAWHGDTQLTIDAPSAGVYQQYLGYRSLQNLPKGQWVRVEFPVPNAVRQALNAANYTDLRFIIAVNVPPGAQTHYVDNFTLGPVQTSCTPVSDNNVCTSDTCNPATGQTVYTPVAPGTSCTDGNACNGAEACNGSGSCVAGTPPVVDDGNVCTADVCTPSGGVTHTPVSAGTSCTDGDACNGAEACNATGVCQAGTPPVVDDGNVCTADACTAGGGVTHTPVSAGTSCSDSNACNGAEACNATGVCQAGTPPVVDDGNPCTADACSAIGGVTHTPVSAGTSCSDANACNGAEACNATGLCVAGTPPVIDDGNVCTADACTPGGGVTHTPVSAGTSCTDGDACNGAEACNATGVCQASTPPVVDDGNPCTADACTAGGGVTHTPVSAGTSCSDANACNGAETCNGSGTCVAGTPPVADDGNVCTADSCSPTGGVMHTPVSAGTSCSDANACNGAETCNGSGTCVAGAPPVVDDGNVCTADACSPSGGVTHTPVGAGVSCSDANVCNGAEACDGAGTCAAGVPLLVDDGNSCTADSCDPSGGVTHTPVSAGTSCADGNACNGEETCSGAGACRAGTPPVLDDGNACTVDSCEANGGIVHAPVGAGVSCADGNMCNGEEACDGLGACVAGTLPAIDDGNACTVDSCDPTNGVVHVAAAPGSACEDGNLCNGTETCSASGICTVGTPLTAPAEENPCITDVTCDPVSGLSWNFESAGTACNIGFICDGVGQCLRDQGGGELPPPLPPGVGRSFGDYALSLPREPRPDCALASLHPDRVAIITGKVTTWDEATQAQVAVANAHVSVPRRCGAGVVTTREDGKFQLPIEGGARQVVRVEADADGDGSFDYLTAERAVETRWNATAGVTDIELVVPAPISGEVPLGGGMVLEDAVFSGPTTTDDRDGDGVAASRTPTLYFRAGTGISATDDEGNPVPLEAAAVRVTEYTVGPTGLARMPAALPPGTAYGYAVELSIDGAEHAVFDQPVVFYLDNFLGAEAARSGVDSPFHVGLPVPDWYYNRQTGGWEREDDGIIVRLVGVDDSSPAQALVDADDDGDADADDEAYLLSHGFELDPAEKERLAAEVDAGRRSVGDELWRVEMEHFSPVDLNWLVRCDAERCGIGVLEPDGKIGGTNGEESIKCGSQLNVETMSLTERFPVAGTPFTLNYNSRTVYGYEGRRHVRINREVPPVPFPLVSKAESLAIGGVHMDPANCDGLTPGSGCGFPSGFTVAGGGALWDGRDANGQIAYGTHGGTWSSYTVWGTSVAQFGFYRHLPIQMTVYDAKLQGLGGWTLSPHHYFDPEAPLLFRGDGTESTSDGRKVEQLDDFGASNNAFVDVQMVEDGTLFFGFAIGGQTWGPGLQYDFKTKASTSWPGVALATDGPDRVYGSQSNVYGYLFSSPMARSDRVNGVVQTGPVIDNQGTPVSALIVGPDRLLYTMRRSTPMSVHRYTEDLEHADGGEPFAVFPGAQSGHITEHVWSALAFYGDTLYMAVSGNSSIFRKGPADPEPILVANLGGPLIAGQPVSLSETWTMGQFRSLHVSADGIFFSKVGSNVLWRIDSEGILRRVVGDPAAPPGAVNGGSALTMGLGPDFSFDFGPDDSIYIVTNPPGKSRILYRVGPSGSLGYEQTGFHSIPSEDGTEVYEMSVEGRHLRTRSALTGDVIRSFEYQDGLLSAIVEGDSEDAENLPSTRIHRETGGVLRIEAPSGQTTTLELDPVTGYARRLIDSSGTEVTLVHDAGGLLREMRDERGFVHSYGYDEFGHLISDTSPGMPAQTLSGWHLWDIEHKNGASEQSVFDFDVDRQTLTQVRTKTNPDGSWVRLESGDGESRLQTTSDGTVVRETFFSHPTFGAAIPVLSSRSTELPSGLTLSESHSLVIADDVRTETHAVNGSSPATSITDLLERTITTTSPQGRTTVVTLDEQGRPFSLEQGDLEPVFLTYDDQGRLTALESGDGADFRSTIFDYFADGTGEPNAGYLGSITNAEGQEVTFTRDAFGRALSSTSAGETTFFGYSARGHLEQLTTPGDDTHLQEWNGVNLLTEYVAPSLSGVDDLLENTYDGARRLSRTTLPGGILLDVSRDALDPEHPERHGRLRSIGSPNSGNGASPFEVDFAYADEGTSPGTAGQLSTLTRGAVETELAWDGPLPLGETNRITGVPGMIGNAYDLTWSADFLPVTETVTVGATALQAAFAYDQDGALVCASPGVSCNAGAGVTYHFDSGPDDAAPDGHGLLEGITAGAVQEAWSHNNFGELTGRQVSVEGTAVFSISYERDLLGRITSQTLNRGATSTTTEYTYDAQGRLALVTTDDPNPLVEPVRAYKYDANGNRLCVTEAPEIDCAEEAEYDAQDRLREMDGMEYSYTDRGTLYQRGEASQLERFTYDALGNLTRVDRTSQPDIDYLIDGKGRRVGKVVNGTLENQYIWGSALRIAAERRNGELVSRFIYGNSLTTPDLVVRKGTTDRVYRVISDHLGSPVYIVNIADADDVWLDASYDEWGNITSFKLDGVEQGTSRGGWPIPQGFAGGLYDPDTGLVRFGARDYDPRVGRWTAKDPILFDGGQGNLYVYVGNDPLNATDVFGLVEGVPDWLLDLSDSGDLQAAGDFFAGVSGAITFGASDILIDATGLGAYGSKCSSARGAGEIAGTIVGFAGAAGAVRMGAGKLGYTMSAGRYTHGGGGFNLLRNGERMFGADWHAFKLGGKMVNRPHLHLGSTASQLKKHWPWQMKGGGGWRLPWD